jgi:hypothetical protein
MKGIIIYNKLIPFKGYVAMTVFPFIFVRREYKPIGKRTINHESIHLRQQMELLVIPFFIWYRTEYLFRAIRYWSFKKAYKNISFEKEAFTNDKDDRYLEGTRKPFAFLHYLRKED